MNHAFGRIQSKGVIGIPEQGHQNILERFRPAAFDDYDIAGSYLLLSPKDYKNLMMNSKVINNPSFKTADVVSNGKVGQICGLTIIKSNNVPADEALIVKGQLAATWKSVAALQTTKIEDPGIKTTIRAWEVGRLMVINPKAIYRITNTQA